MDTTLPTIRAATVDDAKALARFGARTFRATYAPDTANEHLDAFIAEHFGVAIQASELHDPRLRYLLAEIDDALVGYALTGGEASAPPGVAGQRPLLLQRLYVDPASQGRGIGRALLTAVFDMAVARGHDVVWLTVWERNHRATAVYRRWGFIQVGEVPFDLAGEPQVDLVLARGPDRLLRQR